jgi:RsiW-degrading membrane proteinase PrsW (M82 family)
MSELHVTFDGHLTIFGPGHTVRVGRSADNDIVVADPTVSRRHAQVTWQSTGWTWQNAGQAPTFLNGQPVASFGIGQPVEVRLGSPQGPAVRLQPATAQQGPVKTELAANVRPQDSPFAATPGMPAAAAAAGVAPMGTPGTPIGAPGQVQQPVPGPAGYAGAGQPGAPGQAGGPVPQQAVPQPGTPWPGQPGIPWGGQPASPWGAQQGTPWVGQPVALGSTSMGGSFFQTLIPVRSWLHDPNWRQGMRLLIIPYALLPLIFLGLFSSSGNLTTPGWAYSLYVAPLWLLAFWALIRPPKIGKYEIPVAVGIVIWTIIWLNAVTKTVNDHLAQPPLNIIKALAVGFNEEITKALPVLIAALLLLYVGKIKLDPRTWMVMGTIAGLTFGVVEQSIYTPAAIVGIHSATAPGQAVIAELLFVFRLFVDGFQHAVWAGVSGFFIGIAVNYRRLRIPMLLLGISIPAVLHALNDWTLTIFSTVWVAVLIQGLSLLLFLGYTLSASAIERSVRENPAFRRDQSMLMERYNMPGT